jgi:hypothetical protein
MVFSSPEREILLVIEDLRKSLGDLISIKGLVDEEVAQVSRNLDAVMNEYYKLVKEKEYQEQRRP